MLKRLRFAWVLVVFFYLLSLSGSVPATAQVSEQYFQETGHLVKGDFLRKYNSIPNPEKIYGYPITDEFVNGTTGLTVQYFQRAHFELHPENPEEGRVILSLLGEFLYKPGAGEPLEIPSNFPACKFFQETNYQVCYAFLDFFNANGGVAQFGFPISETEILDGRMAQYFQRARFEWHPENPSGQRVVLADLGKQYFTIRQEDPSYLLPNRSHNYPQAIQSLQARAFPSQAVLPVQGSQNIYVLVLDQKLMSVSNAEVTLVVRYPSGNEKTYLAGRTDAQGFIQYAFDLDEKAYGVAEVLVKVDYDTHHTETRCSFRIWY